MKKTGDIYPWRKGNQFGLLIDAETFFPAMLQAISKAETEILLEMYLFESGHVANKFIEALIDAAHRGVRVLALLDDFGCRKLTVYDKHRLAENGIQLKFYNPIYILKWFEFRWLDNLARDHRKLLLVDHHEAFIGGAGITDEFMPQKNRQKAWRETMVSARGPIVNDWCHLFRKLWHDEAAYTPEATTAGNMEGRLVSSARFFSNDLRRSVLNHINSAEQRVWFCTAYFVPSGKLRRALRHAAARGVDVRLLLPGPFTDHPGVRRAGQRHYARLLRSGVRIFEYQPRFLHAKTLLCDHWVSIGSSNLDRWNLHWNLEANQNVLDSGFAMHVSEMMEKDFENSVECTYEDWLNRPWWERLSIYVYSRIGLWMTSWERRNEKDDNK